MPLNHRADIENLVARKKLNSALFTEDDITNRVTDVAIGKLFAFWDKNENKGFFWISDYIANVPDNDRATLTLYVKMQR
jgi:hypothetical protein